ncbi:MAG TPA: hypothetical protein VM674_04225 [Candidatus Acidoferrum sp.]|nr:hypothetical protein [Candidatus Acidoferrum sp.]
MIVIAVAASAVLGHQLGISSTGRRAQASPSPKTLMITNPYLASATWYRGNLQVASLRGIGRDLPSAIGRWYASHGYAFLGISDMNTSTWTSEYSSSSFPGIAVVDESYTFGDLLAIDMDHWLPASNIQGAVDWISRDGGLAVLAAPRSISKPIDESTILQLRQLFGLEVYDAHLGMAGQADATALWDRMLSNGQRVYAFAGDDVQSLDDPAIGKAWIEVQADRLDLDAINASIRRGAFYASTGAEFTSLTLSGRTISAEAPSGTVVRFLGRGGQLLKTVPSAGSYQVAGDEGYVRVEAIRDDGARAWSQPFYLDWR